MHFPGRFSNADACKSQKFFWSIVLEVCAQGKPSVSQRFFSRASIVQLKREDGYPF